MLKVLYKASKYIYDNGPTVAFWTGILFILNKWYLNQHAPVKIALFAGALFALLLSLRKAFREAKQQILASVAEASIGRKDDTFSTDKLVSLIDEMPTNISLITIYKYAKEYANSWASDGQLLSIYYYIEVTESSVQKTAQIFIESSTRAEKLTMYLPKRSDEIEEFRDNVGYRSSRMPEIYSFKGWKEELKKNVEKSSSDIAKADKVRVQLSPFSNGLRTTLYLEKGNRKWSRSFQTPEEGSL